MVIHLSALTLQSLLIFRAHILFKEELSTSSSSMARQGREGVLNSFILDLPICLRAYLGERPYGFGVVGRLANKIGTGIAGLFSSEPTPQADPKDIEEWKQMQTNPKQ